uniref:Uncharacterized protein n=1 Tax=Lotharella globosa TaxID=91324 RepID=A0A7S3YRA2_9EUKA
MKPDTGNSDKYTRALTYTLCMRIHSPASEYDVRRSFRIGGFSGGLSGDLSIGRREGSTGAEVSKGGMRLLDRFTNSRCPFRLGLRNEAKLDERLVMVIF